LPTLGTTSATTVALEVFGKRVVEIAQRDRYDRPTMWSVRGSVRPVSARAEVAA
jgi:hypothetical protein